MNRMLLIACIAMGVSSGVRAQLFEKVTTGPMVTDSGDSRSVNWIDVNKDNYQDCFISNGPQGGQNNRLYLNDGSGNFIAATQDTICKDNSPSDGATFADLDNDGDLDGFVANWYNANNLMYLNDGAGAFSRVGPGPAVNDAGYSETAAWADYDNDGRVDLYVTNSAGNKKNFLYHNDGNGLFTKVTSGDMVTDAQPSRNVSWADIDNDGDLDLFVTNEESQNERLYRNDGSGNFAALTAGPLLNDGGHTMSSSWADYDNDGDLDVFLANDRGFNSLFRNDGDFNFTKMLADTVCKTPSRSFSAAWADTDNDGDLDLFVTNAFGPALKLVNFFYQNNGDGTFSRNTEDATVGDSSWSYGCAFGDYDNNGFQDLAVATCRFSGVDYPDFLYRNIGNNFNWLSISLEGTQSNRSAIGARVYVKAELNGVPVWQMREISAQSAYCGQNDMRAHFGLNGSFVADSVKIRWPSGLVDVYTGVGAGQFVHYTEEPASSISGSAQSLHLNIYPNPVTNRFTLSSSKGFNGREELSIHHIDGRLMHRELLNAGSLYTVDLDRGRFTPGLYLLQVKEGSNAWVRRLVLR